MDDTLYPLSSGLNLACRKNIEGEFGSSDTWVDSKYVASSN